MPLPKAYDPQQGYKYQFLCRCYDKEWDHLDYATDDADMKHLRTEYNLVYRGGGHGEFKIIKLPRKYWKPLEGQVV